MQRRVELVRTAVAVLGLAAIVLGYVAGETSEAVEQCKKAWVAVVIATVLFLCGAAMKRGFSSSRPGWRYRSGFFFLATIVSAVATGYAIAANPGLGCGVAGALLALMAVVLATAASAHGPATGRRRAVAHKRLRIAWVAVLIATVPFLYNSRGNSYGCTELRSELFFLASMVSACATGFAIAAHVA